MNTDLLFRHLQELKRTISAHEVSLAELHNAIFLIEERMFEIDDCKAALHGFNDEY